MGLSMSEKQAIVSKHKSLKKESNLLNNSVKYTFKLLSIMDKELQEIALKDNEIHYTSFICKKYHFSKRVVSNGTCVECNKEYYENYVKPKHVGEEHKHLSMLEKKVIRNSAILQKKRNKKINDNVISTIKLLKDKSRELKERAIKNGEQFFLPITCCKNYHFSKRLTNNGMCCECRDITAKYSYYKKHKEIKNKYNWVGGIRVLMNCKKRRIRWV